MKTWLFNPFKFIAGYKALALGFIGMFATAIVCLLSKVHLDGVIDIHTGRITASYFYFIEPVIDWLCIILPLYIFGRSLSVSSVRFIDIAGTAALARWPMIFAVLLTMLSPRIITNDPKKFLDAMLANPSLMIQLAVVGLLMIPFVIWTVALMYNAYSVSANLKGPKAAWSFIASFVIAEIISKGIFYVMR